MKVMLRNPVCRSVQPQVVKRASLSAAMTLAAIKAVAGYHLGHEQAAVGRLDIVMDLFHSSPPPSDDGSTCGGAG